MGSPRNLLLEGSAQGSEGLLLGLEKPRATLQKFCLPIKLTLPTASFEEEYLRPAGHAQITFL